MGFDVYGLSPKVNTEKPKSVSKYEDDDGWVKWQSMDKKDTEEYFQADQKYKSENPGIYYRSNVWWWRTLWDYTCEVCYDILSEDDINGGQFNDGHILSKTKVNKMVKAMKEAETDGFLNEFESHIPEDTSYPFSVPVAIEFRKFLEQSGGIEIK